LERVVDCAEKPQYLGLFEQSVLPSDQLIATQLCVKFMKIGSYYLLHELKLHLVINSYLFEINPALLLQTLCQSAYHAIKVTLGKEVRAMPSHWVLLQQWVEPGLKDVWTHIQQLRQNGYLVSNVLSPIFPLSLMRLATSSSRRSGVTY